jgi:hypothetical protein
MQKIACAFKGLGFHKGEDSSSQAELYPESEI